MRWVKRCVFSWCSIIQFLPPNKVRGVATCWCVGLITGFLHVWSWYFDWTLLQVGRRLHVHSQPPKRDHNATPNTTLRMLNQPPFNLTLAWDSDLTWQACFCESFFLSLRIWSSLIVHFTSQPVSFNSLPSSAWLFVINLHTSLFIWGFLYAFPYGLIKFFFESLPNALLEFNCLVSPYFYLLAQRIELLHAHIRPSFLLSAISWAESFSLLCYFSFISLPLHFLLNLPHLMFVVYNQ